MNFTIVAIVTSVAALFLGAGWLFGGRLMLKRWRIEPSPASLLIGRRLGAVYLGMAMILYLERYAPPSELRSITCIGMLVVLLLLAALGLFEFKLRRVGPAMLVSVAVEVLLAGGFALALA
jgi:hypothetical protein